MKQILFALALVGLAASANAQSNSKYAQNYKVCAKGNGYKVCGDHEAAVQTQQQGRDVTIAEPDPSLSLLNTNTYLGYRSATASSNRRNPRILVAYDDPNGAYEGKETRINDGVKKNRMRNTNYLNTSVELPANDGGR
jgi:hypothetical protein